MFGHEVDHACESSYLKEMSSTSKTNVALGGMTGGIPLGPYA
jgi:hypothetical protein